MGKTLKVVELVGNFPLSAGLQLCRQGLRQPDSDIREGDFRRHGRHMGSHTSASLRKPSCHCELSSLSPELKSQPGRRLQYLELTSHEAGKYLVFSDCQRNSSFHTPIEEDVF